MRIATYNVEWFSGLFDNSDQPERSQDWSARWNVTKARQLEALAHVFQALDADAVMIIEAPDQSPNRSTVTALETFAAGAGLRARKAVIGFGNHTKQEIALMYDPNALTVAHDPQSSERAPRFDLTFEHDLDIDTSPEQISWSKPPLELLAQTRSGHSVRLIGVHAKSKAPHGAKTDSEARQIQISNRRKQLAQCIWLRARVDDHLDADEDVIVLGDFNDGPGLDQFEKLFGRSGVEIVLGRPDQTPLFDPHANIPLRTGAPQVSTARFFDRKEDRYFNALLDFVMVSPNLANLGAWRVMHPFDDAVCFKDQHLCRALLDASDHFPVVLEIDI